MKTILFTGCTDGIGLEAARQLVSKGHTVLMHGRNPAKLASVAKEMGVDEKNTFLADLTDLSQVYGMAKAVKTRHETLDVLVNNAGVFTAPNTRVVTKDGLDMRWAVNTVAPYVLTKELLPIIPKHGRVINVSSAAQSPVNLQKAFPKKNGRARDADASPYASSGDFQAYAESKLGMMMWTFALAADYTDHVLVSLNPASMLGTKMVREGFGVTDGKDIGIGANILVQAAVGKQFNDASGRYFDNDRESFGRPHPDANDMNKNKALTTAMDEWLLSKQQCIN